MKNTSKILVGCNWLEPILTLIISLVVMPLSAQVVINEVMIKPQSSSTSAAFQSLKVDGASGDGAEYIELYNPGCAAVDISCYYLVAHNAALASNQGTFRFPSGSSISSLGFFTIGGPAAGAVDINLFDYTTGTDSDLLVTGASRWYLSNFDGYIALYDETGVLVDAVYWGTAPNYNTEPDIQGDPPHVPAPVTPGTTCANNPVSLSRPTLAEVEYIGSVGTIGNVCHRVTDGSSTWDNNGSPTLGTCNGACETTPPSEDASFTLTDYCVGSSNSASGIVTPGGTFAFNPIPGDGATINSSTAEITNGVAGTTYTIEYTTSGTCPGSSTETVTVLAIDDPGFTLTDFCESSSNAATGIATSGGTFTFEPVPGDGATINGSTGGITNGVAGTTYTVEYTTSGVCPDSSTETVSVLAIDDPGFTLTDFCEGSSNAATGIATSGGTFTFEPVPGDGATINNSTGAITGGVAGATYTIEYTTSGACPDSSTETVTVLAIDDPSFTLTDFCEGSSNAATGIATSGGTFTFDPVPGDGATINNSTGAITGGVAGATYTIEYTTSGACPDSSTETVTVLAIDDPSFTLTDFCEGSSNAATGIATSGGTFTFEPVPGDGATINNSTGAITGGVAGATYTIEYTTSGACPDSSTETVTVLTIDDPGFTLTDFCEGSSNAATGIVTSGGTFAFNPAPGDGATIDPSTGELFDEVGGTTYSVQYTTAGTCPDSSIETLTVFLLPVADAGNASATICDRDTISIGGSPAASGGNGSFTYTWLPNSNINDNTADNPLVWPSANTTYVLEVEDGNNCVAYDSIQIIVNPTPVAVATGAPLVICDGDTTTLDATGSSGGTGSLSFLWSPAADLSNAASGTPQAWPTASTDYLVTVTDANSCQDTATVSITVNPLPTIDISGMVITDANCGLSNGAITGITASGTPTLTYDWDDGSGSVGSNLDLTAVASGAYTLTVTDGNMCSDQFGPYGINDIGGPNIDISGLVNTPDTCGQNLGSITGVVVTGGSGSLTYDWSDGASSVGSSLDLTGVLAGTYTLVVTDSAGCASASGPFTISEIAAPALDLTGLVNAADTCGQTVGSVTGIAISGGTGPFTYTWNDGVATVATTADLLNVSPGSYSITVTDDAGCSVTGGPFNVLDVPGPTLDLSAITVTDANCGQSDGSVTGAVVSGGTGSISYAWGDGVSVVGTNADLLNIPAGSYTLTVIDDAGCVATGTSVSVIDVPGPTVNDGSVVLTQAACGGSDGSITGITVSGGTTPYTYDWSDVAGTVGSGLDLLSQPSGSYTITVTDSNGCIATSGPYTITEAGAPVIDVAGLTTDPETCGQVNGAISGLSITGGTSPFAYSWSDGTSIIDSTLDVSGLDAGSYTLTVTDSNGCVASHGPVDIEDLTGPVLDVSGLMVTDASCELDNGAISGIMVAGGNGAVSYLWSNADTTLDVSGLAAGGYSLIVTDSLGCTDSIGTTVGTIVTGTVLAVDDSASTLPNVQVNVMAGSNDSGDQSTIAIIGGPSNGVAVDNGSGDIDYTSDVGFQGVDVIVYTICDAACTNICDTARIFILVKDMTPIDVPNGFSPNVDGVNDFFVILGLEQYPNNEIVIFNRWGDEVFQAAPYQNNWDGTTTNNTLKISGDKVTDGTYYFILNLNVDGIDPINGFVELRRQ